MARQKHSVGRKAIVEQVKANDKARAKTGKNIKGQRSTPPMSQVKLKQLGYCGAKRREPDENGGAVYCMKKKGWGTDHPGMGACKYHGGSTVNHRVSALRKYQIEFMGRPKDISPIDAIVWSIKITAGEVEWLGSQIAEVNNQNWIEDTIAGKQLHVFQRARADAMDRLVRYSKDAIALGLAERAVRVAEQFGATIARLLDGVAKDLELTNKQKAMWPVIVRRHLILLEGGSPVTDEDRANPMKQLTSGEKK